MKIRLGPLPVAIALAALLATAAFAQDSEWFSQSGYTIMEAVGSDQFGYVLIGTNETGAFQLLSKGDWYKDRFRLDAVGSEQAKVVTKDNTTAAVPILHRNVPADIFLLALSTVTQRSVVIGAQVDALKTVTPELLSDPAKLAAYCQEEGLDVRVFDDCMVVRKGAFPKDLKPFAPAGPQLACAVNVMRSDLSTVAASLAKVSGKIVTPTGKFDGKLTVRSIGLSPEALAYYVEKASGAGFKVEEPKPVVQAPTAAAPVAAPRTVAARDRFKELMRSGNHLAAARFAQAIIKKHPAKAAGYNYYGLALWKLGHKQTAVKAWQKALRLEPANQYAQQVLRKIKTQQVAQAGTSKAPARL